MSPDLGVLLLGEHPMDRLPALAEHIDDLGYNYLWIADEKFYRDPFVSLAVAAQATRRVCLGTGVTEPYSRHPALLAMAIATLAELCPGRCVLGLGAGGPGFPPMGIHRARPPRALREAVAIIRGLLAGEHVDLRGEVISFRGGALHFAPRSVPIYVAARGRQMLRTAGSIADGVIMAPFASSQAVKYAEEAVREGADAAGRQHDLPRRVARVDVCIAPDRELARRAVRYFVALPLWVSYPNWDYVQVLDIELPPQLRELVARRDYRDIAAAGGMLPEVMLDHFAIAGTRDEVADKLAALSAIVDQIIIHPIAPDNSTVGAVIDDVATIWREIT